MSAGHATDSGVVANARMFGIDHRTVTKIRTHSVPPGYCGMRPPGRLKARRRTHVDRLDLLIDPGFVAVARCLLPDRINVQQHDGGHPGIAEIVPETTRITFAGTHRSKTLGVP